MALDPGISLAVHAPAVETPLDSLSRTISVADMLSMMQERQQTAGLRAADTKLRQAQVQQAQKQIDDKNALDQAVNANTSYDEDAGDLKYNDPEIARALHKIGKDDLFPTFKEQRDTRLQADRDRALKALNDAHQTTEAMGVPADNFLSLPDDQKEAQYNALVQELAKVDPTVLKKMPPKYGPDAVAKIQELQDHRSQIRRVADKLTEAKAKEEIRTTTEEGRQSKLAELNTAAAAENGVSVDKLDQATKDANYEKVYGTKITRRAPARAQFGQPVNGSQIAEGSLNLSTGEPADRNPLRQYIPVYHGDEIVGYQPSQPKQSTFQQKNERTEKAYAFTIGKNYEDLTDADRVAADHWYAEQTPSKKTQIDKRLEIYERSPELYQALFGHGGTGADKAVTQAQKASILGRINTEITKQGLQGKEADDFKAQRLDELKEAGIDMGGTKLPGGTSSTGSYDTKLTPEEETQFQAWKAKYAPNDSGVDYDLRGAFKAGLKPDAKTGHWPDTFKKPNHPTFSNESKYAVGADAAKAGRWTGPNHDQFVKPGGKTASKAQVDAAAKKAGMSYGEAKARIEAAGGKVNE